MLIEVPDKKRCRRVSVLNTLDEFERLIKLLRSFQRPVRVAFEATGNYHRALAFQLDAAGFNIKLFPSRPSSWSRRILPGTAAAGGMVFPAVFYIYFNCND